MGGWWEVGIEYDHADDDDHDHDYGDDDDDDDDEDDDDEYASDNIWVNLAWGRLC